MFSKLRIEVITLNSVQNYGSVLQALATQEKLKEYNCEVSIINFVREDVDFKNLSKTWCGSNFIKRMIFYPTKRRWKKIFGDFNKKYLNLTEKKYVQEKDFINYELNADAYCTGSDQVWNSKWNRGYILPLYLSFIPKEKFKFAYAASFGQNFLLEEEIEVTKKYIEEYNYISVRESSAKKILEKQYKYKNVVNIIDPTLVMPADFWRKYTKKSKKIKEKYILIYNLNRSKEFDKYAKEISNRTGFKLYRFCTRYDQFFRVGKSLLVPNIFDFISLIDNAEYVITDSFHATAFSANLNTKPICIYPNKFSSRLENFLRLIESSDRHISNFEDFSILDKTMDFNKINKILDLERKKVDEYLNTIIKKIKEQRNENNFI